ncbi:major capsid protein [Rhizobium sp. LjRoot98]|uniref:major capsid protein n=1 Tax=Rhizobium sp. LjRoot98 TaxID=3342345 RepID=UPI003ECC3604
MSFDIANVFSPGQELWETAVVTGFVNKQPYVPELASKWFKWNSEGVAQKTLIIERNEGKLAVIPEAPRGADGIVLDRDERNATPIIIPHHPVRETLLAVQFEGIRAVGQELEETVETERDKFLVRLSRANRLIWEIGRMGAITGIVIGVNRDGQIVVNRNWYNTFTGKDGAPLVQTTKAINFASSNTNIRSALISARDESEAQLGDLSARGYVAVCGKNRFATITDHPKFEKAFERYNDGSHLRDDLGVNGFQIASDIQVVKYNRATVGGLTLIGDDDMYIVPLVDEGMFETRFGPGTSMFDLGKPGLPEYVSAEPLKHGKGVEFEAQTNPVSWCSRLEAIVKVTQS